MLYIYYLLYFWKEKKKRYLSLNQFESKVSKMTPAYIVKLSFKVCSTNIKAQKMNNLLLKTFKIVIAGF